VNNSDRSGAGPLVDGYWSRALGRDYVATAFRLAREIDPASRLFYNDYDHGLALGPKSNRIYALLKQLCEDGVPVEGVGLQLHCNLVNPPVRRDLVENFRRLGALGLRVQVTELDVEIMTASGSLEDRLARQARVYSDVVSAAVESRCVEAVVMWGFTDRFRQEALLRRKKLPPQETPMWIFDRDYRPKPAFDAVVAALSARRAE
jgi:endo-1,4-beta-xylanase